MDRETYREAFDKLTFSPDFQARTQALLHQRAQAMEQEESSMKIKHFRKPAVFAAVAALLVVSVSAAAYFLSPAQVAERAGDTLLAQAFESEDAVLLNETVESGGYQITLSGLVSGAGLSQWAEDVDEARTYAVVSLAASDGTPLDWDSFSLTDYTVTPLVSGYSPNAVNTWTLNAMLTGFLQNGVCYFLLDTQNLEMFADHTVYLAVYEGGSVPSRNQFTMGEDGSIAFREDFTGAHALFTLPLDESLADPEAAQDFIEGTGVDPMFGFAS